MSEGEVERIDPNSNLYAREAAKHLAIARGELSAGIDVAEDDEIRQAMESANLALSSVLNGVNGIVEMMNRRAEAALSNEHPPSIPQQPDHEIDAPPVRVPDTPESDNV